MNELFPHIFEWSWYSEEKGYNFNGHVVIAPRNNVIIDPPPLNESDLAWLEQHLPYQAILLTNRDHTREADMLRKQFGIPIYAPELDAPHMEIKADRTYQDQDMLPGKVKAIHIPDNKSPGETALWLGEGKDLLILGDALVAKQPGRLTLMPPEKYADAKKAREGIRALLPYTFDAILVGDGHSILTGGKEAVLQFLQSP
jgi:glyoxylase-like metal-dependent hydrolase (beta-lactamase superfamily II)